MKVNGKYTAEYTKEFMNVLAQNGFGEIQTGARGTVSLKRKAYDDMDADTQELFDELDIDQEVYRKAQKGDIENKKA